MSFCTAHRPKHHAEYHAITQPDLTRIQHRMSEPRLTEKRKAPVPTQIFTDWASI